MAGRLRLGLDQGMEGALFIRDLPRQPKHALVFIIDTLDECADKSDSPGPPKGSD